MEQQTGDETKCHGRQRRDPRLEADDQAQHDGEFEDQIAIGEYFRQREPLVRQAFDKSWERIDEGLVPTADKKELRLKQTSKQL